MAWLLITALLVRLFAHSGASMIEPDLCSTSCECLQGLPFVVECKNDDLSQIPHLEAEPYPFEWALFFDVNKISKITAMPTTDNLILLSFNDNPILEIEDMAFANLTKLRRLTLKQCSLTGDVFTLDAFKGPRNEEDGADPLPLEYLDVSHNDIQSLGDHAFRHFDNLKTLIISDNPFHDFDDTTSKAFGELIGVQTLDLSRVQIKRIPEKFFSRMRQLKELILAGNNFMVVPDEVNYIQSLERLVLDNNPIKVLSKNDKSYFHGPSQLSQLHLSYMPDLNKIDAEAFYNLDNLKVVTISYNPNLNFIHKMAFASSGIHLKKVHLNNNNLAVLDNELLDWAALEEIDIQNNPWVCDCRIVWFTKEPLENLNANKPQLTEYIICAKPNDATGQSLPYLASHDYAFKCPEIEKVTNPYYYGPLIVTTIFVGALLLLSATVLCTYVLYQKSRSSGFSGTTVQYRRADFSNNLESIAENVYA
ncbi:leucine-rich repeat neuronal protein 1 [Hyalella azteca]|uniref:Leucine-rich repeat neuronal protein 1 n=1 Tax=Hyalella azteca TaxID=294128 RepID=A0A8B7N8Z8_HYAAZ|nr:leucine-rich repeat neuronal protein 1 [Hyalella azteca]